MKITIEIDPTIIEHFIKRKYDEAAEGCMCNDCFIVRALVCGVLDLEEEETTKC